MRLGADRHAAIDAAQRSRQSFHPRPLTISTKAGPDVASALVAAIGATGGIADAWEARSADSNSVPTSSSSNGGVELPTSVPRACEHGVDQPDRFAAVLIGQAAQLWARSRAIKIVEICRQSRFDLVLRSSLSPGSGVTEAEFMENASAPDCPAGRGVRCHRCS